jgi:iron(III) transport system permease protein
MFMGSFMTLFGFFDVPNVWTVAHWETILFSNLFMRAMGNTLLLSGGAALVSVTVYTVIAYISVKTKFVGRGALDILTWLPFTLPGIVVGLGLLWFVLDVSLLRVLYGSMSILIIVSVLTHMTLSVQVFKSVLLQLGHELEEASRVCGASWWATYRRIVVPILMPAVLLIATMVFAGSARTVSGIVLLVTSENQPLSIVQLEHMMNGDYGAASVVGTVVVLLSTGIAILSRCLGLDSGIHRS